MVNFEKKTPGIDLGGGLTRRIMSHDGGMMAVAVDFEKDAVGALHSHPHEQITYVVSGRFTATLGEETCEIGPGDSYYCAPNEPHGVVCLEAGRLLDVFTPQREDFLR